LVDVVAERQGAAVVRAGAGAAPGRSLKIWSLSVEWASLLEGRCSDEQERDVKPREPREGGAPRARGRGRGRGLRGRQGRGRGGAPGGPEGAAEEPADILGEMLGEVMEHSDDAYDGQTGTKCLLTTAQITLMTMMAPLGLQLGMPRCQVCMVARQALLTRRRPRRRCRRPRCRPAQVPTQGPHTTSPQPQPRLRQ
jgi:hypothetical protein